MALRGNSFRYGSIAVAHWISALAVAALLLLGFLASNSDDPQQKIAILRLHVPVGSLVLIFTLCRTVWYFLMSALSDWQTSHPGNTTPLMSFTACYMNCLLSSASAGWPFSLFLIRGSTVVQGGWNAP